MNKLQKITKNISLIVIASVILSDLTACAPLVLASAASGVAVLTDRRTTGTYVEDKAIELKAMNKLNENLTVAKQSHVSVLSFNERVLVTGEASSDNVKNQIEQIIKTLPKVKTVYNEIKVSKSSSFKESTYDSWLSTKVKANLTSDLRVNPLDIKVMTNKNTVYLMGLVTQQEAEIATNISRKVSGVGKVVKLFEYIQDPNLNNSGDQETQMATTHAVTANETFS